MIPVCRPIMADVSCCGDFTTYRMVEAGLGVSFNQQLISRKWNGRVSEVPLDSPHYVGMGIEVPEAGEVSPAAKVFIRHINESIGVVSHLTHKNETIL